MKHPAPLPEPLLKPFDVMQFLGCSRSFVQDHRTELGGRKVGRLLRFDRESVQRFIDRGRVAPPVEPERPGPARIQSHPSWLDPRATNPLTGRPYTADRPTARGRRG